MKLCPTHWNALYQSLEARGLEHCMAHNKEEAIAKLEQGTFDAMLSACSFIYDAATKMGGEYLKDPGLCPICEAQRHGAGRLNPDGQAMNAHEIESLWLGVAADGALDEARRRGLLKVLN